MAQDEGPTLIFMKGSELPLPVKMFLSITNSSLASSTATLSSLGSYGGVW